MSIDRVSSRSDRTTIAVLFFVVVLSCSYFFTGGGWNQASRLDLVRAIIDRHTLAIDAYADNTGDKSVHRDRTYSDKAPGTALLAVPFVAVAKVVAQQLSNNEQTVLMAEARVSILVCAALPTALACIAIYLIARRWRCRSKGAAIAAWAYGLATPAWAYGTFLWGHALAASCLILGFAVVLACEGKARSKRGAWLSIAAGGLLGWATITEYTAAIPAVLITGMALGRAWPQERRAALWASAWVGLGALGPLAVLGIYNDLAFDSPFHLGYTSVVGFEGMKTGFFGIAWPRLAVLGELLWGARRGLLWLSPVLLLAPIGLYTLGRDRERRIPVVTAAGIFVYYLLLNASYEYWDGGHTYGPRHLAAGLPFLCLGLAAMASTKLARIVLGALLIASLALTLMGVALHPQTPPVSRPFVEIYWPSLLDARLSQNQDALFNSGATPSQNFGEWLGLRGLASLLPLLFLWLLGAGILCRIQHRREEGSPPSP